MNHKRFAMLAAAACSGALLLAACGGQGQNTPDEGASPGGDQTGASNVSGEVRVDGSSTVGPLSSAAGELFKEQQNAVNVSVGQSGTGAGFKKFCAGETDISGASRPIKDEEKAECDKAGIQFTEILVANDALTVVVNKDNDWVDCMTVDQLKKIWEPAAEGKITTWQQVDPKYPADKLVLFGAGTDSGTFDYFTGEINGEEGASRTDYSPTEDDNVTVQGVQGAKGAMGYFGLSYFEENADNLKALQIDGGEGCVAPSIETAQAGEYKPLGRPLFIYVANKSYTDKPQVKAYVDFYVGNDEEITKLAKFVPLNEEQRTTSKSAVEGLGS